MLYNEQIIATDNSTCYIYPYNSYVESVMDSGCYYITPKECKDIIINEGLSGIPISDAIIKVRNLIQNEVTIITSLYFVKKEVLSYYAGDLAESMVYAARVGKGVEIAIGYPKALVIKIN